MFDKKIIETAKDKSLELLHELVTEQGFIASHEDLDNYKRVFSRDGVVAGISSLYFNDKKLLKAFKDTLFTLQKYQDQTGRIPSNVSLDGKKISYGTTVGRIDATIWFVIGCCKYYLHTNDKNFLKKMKTPLKKSLFYLDCLELNGKELLYIPPGGDWADEYINEGYVLFDQLLYLLALRYYGKVFGDENVDKNVKKLQEIIRINYFPHKKHIGKDLVYQEKLYNKFLKEYSGPTPIASFSAFGANFYDDLFAISLLFNFDILDFKQKQKIEKYLDKKHDDGFLIYPSFHPVIEKDDKDWSKLENNYIFRLKNKPHEYHNGGRWPMVFGFYLNSKDEVSEEELSQFARILERDDYIFSEFYHGLTLAPMGTKKLGFSASGYLLAYQRFISNNKIFKN